MDTMLKVSNYKCYGNDAQGYEKLCPITVIVGRNNTGKSALLDLVRFTVELANQDVQNFLKNNPVEIHYSGCLTEDALLSIFPETTKGGPIPGSHWGFGCQWIGAPISCAVNVRQQVRATQFKPAQVLGGTYQTEYAEMAAKSLHRPFDGYTFVRLAADRDITPEPASAEVGLNAAGVGLTNLFRLTMTQRQRNRDIVTKDILGALNQIFEPDGTFEEIQIVEDATIGWEIYLREKGKDRVQLSQCGSGLKTILMVLTIFHLGPAAETSTPRVIHAFEELENNLHPAALRRLLAYIERFSKEKECPLFLTTHSSTTIDFFSKNPDAQIVHVVKEGGRALVRTVTTYVDHKNILDDLDIRASDLLQANGIIWVEGPTDRTYLNKWIELESKGQIQEGIHYQIVFYGGRLLSHLSAVPLLSHLSAVPQETTLINVLSVNRNVALVIDSDSRSETDAINATKKRMQEEVERIDGFSWVTAGREIENYVTLQTVKRAFSFGGTIPAPERTANFFDAINLADSGRGEYWRNHKHLLAEKLVMHMELQDALNELDLKTQVASLLVKIKSWNQL